MLCKAGYAKLQRFHLTELHYRVIILSAQVGLQGTYSYVLVDSLLLYIFWVALVVFEKGCIVFAPIALNAIYHFTTFRYYNASMSDYYNFFRVFY